MWSPGAHSISLNGPVPFIFVVGVRALRQVLVADAQVEDRVERTRPGYVGGKRDGVLVGRLDPAPVGGAGPNRSPSQRLWILRPLEGVLDIVAGQLASVVKLDPLAQVEFDALAIRAEVPAFGQARLGGELLVVRDELIVDLTDGIAVVRGPDERIQRGDIANHADPKRSAGFYRLRRSGCRNSHGGGGGTGAATVAAGAAGAVPAGVAAAAVGFGSGAVGGGTAGVAAPPHAASSAADPVKKTSRSAARRLSGALSESGEWLCSISHRLLDAFGRDGRVVHVLIDWLHAIQRAFPVGRRDVHLLEGFAQWPEVFPEIGVGWHQCPA